MKNKQTRRKHRFSCQFPKMLKKTSSVRRRVLKNLENLTLNTKKYLELKDEEWKIRKPNKFIRRRYSGSSSSTSSSLDNVDSSLPANCHIEETIEETSSSDDFVKYDEVVVDTAEKDHSVVENNESMEVEYENLDELLNVQVQAFSVPTIENGSLPEDESIDDSVLESDLESKADSDKSDDSSYKLRSPQKCRYCHGMSSAKFSGSPPDSKTEDEILSLADLSVTIEEGEEEPPQYRLTEFSVFDKAGHLCPFDGDLIQKNVKLNFSGYIKPVYDHEPGTEGGYPCKDMGPITEWWITGLDGSDENERVIIGFSSQRADYYLLQPTTDYAPLLESLNEKIRVTKAVFQFLLSEDAEYTKTYEELLKHLETQSIYEEELIRFANFICEQIRSYDSGGDDDETHLLPSECMQHLALIAGVDLTRNVKISSRRRKINGLRKDSSFRKATTTPFVNGCFESIFTDQMDRRNRPEDSEPKLRPCEVRLRRLENLQRYDGFWRIPSTEKPEEDTIVQDAFKNNMIRSCAVKLTPMNPEIVDKYISRLKEMDKNQVKKKRKLCSEEGEEYLTKKARTSGDDEVVWQSEAEEIDNRTHYTCAQVGDEFVSVGNFVCFKYGGKIGVVKYMYEDGKGRSLGHFHWFVSSRRTILGEQSAKQEIFMTDECEDVNLSDINSVLDVEHLPITVDDWRSHGNKIVSEWISKNVEVPNKFFYQKRYDRKYGNFKDLPDDVEVPNTCTNCSRKTELETREIPLPIGEMTYNEKTKEYTIAKVRWRDEYYTPGSSVFLLPGSLIEPKPVTYIPRPEKYDEEMYPEKYRKKLSQEEIPREDPFDVGFISRIFTKKRNVKNVKEVHIELKVLYRPQNTHLNQEMADREDLNKLYWSEEDCATRFDQIQGKCFLSYEKNLKLSVDEWWESGPFRFYFSQAYDPKQKCFIEPPSYAKEIGKFDGDADDANVPYDYPEIEPLTTMDVFAGCGGLSDGLHQSGVAECRWAIEKFSAPAAAFKLNNPKAVVFQEDCNDLLRDIMNPEECQKRTGQKRKNVPKRGEIDLLCGGPPCQGFSRMNRFKNGTYSKFKNSLVTTYLSYCDFFRPRFFILENVRDFISTSGGMVFKLTMSCLVRMGYQVGFGVLQCGRYGIAQSRRRTIIMAAAPGEILPKFPEPTHTFPLNSFLDVTVTGERFKSDIQWVRSAPHRSVTVGDAISDLPKIENNSERERMCYKKEPQTHFQRTMRGVSLKASDELHEHVCKKLTLLILERIKYIPQDPPGDWRDLPNIEVKLSDGSIVKKLEYTHNSWKNPQTKKGQLRGVCKCATSPKRTTVCNVDAKQPCTLIPWCLPHTSDRHNQWSGLYGRVPKAGYFRTVVTNPEPMGKQGRVLHPDQNRVVSIRECARSQGFKDSFQFYGDRQDKYAQIGNAVAPPLGKALGLEIKKCVAAKIAKEGRKK